MVTVTADPPPPGRSFRVGVGDTVILGNRRSPHDNVQHNFDGCPLSPATYSDASSSGFTVAGAVCPVENPTCLNQTEGDTSTRLALKEEIFSMPTTLCHSARWIPHRTGQELRWSSCGLLLLRSASAIALADRSVSKLQYHVRKRSPLRDRPCSASFRSHCKPTHGSPACPSGSAAQGINFSKLISMSTLAQAFLKRPLLRLTNRISY